MSNPAFQRFVAASGLTNLADGIATVAWAWMASLLTRDALLIALMPVALRLPWFLFALPAGIVTDRVDRRRLILAMDVVRAAAFGGAAIAILASLPLAPAPGKGLAQPQLFFALMLTALAAGAAEVFRDNAAQTMLPSLVDHSQLEGANGRLWSVELIGNALVGPALGAFLIAVFVPAPFALNAISYGVAIILVYRLRGVFKPAKTAVANWRAELKEGFNFLRAEPLLRSLAWITGAWNLLFHMSAIALVLHVQDNLNMGATAYGALLAAGAVGGILAGLVAERIIAAFGPKRTAQYALMFSAPSFLAMAYAPNWWALSATILAFEFSGLIWNTVSVSYRQRRIPDALLGRVNSLYRLLAWGLIPVGLVLSGIVVRLAEPLLGRSDALSAPFFVSTVGALVLAILGWRAIGRGFDQSS